VDTLVSGSLGVQLCADTGAAAQVIARQQRGTDRRAGARIWPLHQMPVDTRRSRLFQETLTAFPQAVDPAAMLRLVPTAPPAAVKAVYKAVGQVLVVDTDQTAAQVMAFLRAPARGGRGTAGAAGAAGGHEGIGCVTLSGNTHSHGSLSVGPPAGPRPPRLQQLPRYHALAQALSEACRARHRLARALAAAQRRAAARRDLALAQDALAEAAAEAGRVAASVEAQRGPVAEIEADLAAVRQRLLDAEAVRDAAAAELQVRGACGVLCVVCCVLCVVCCVLCVVGGGHAGCP